MAAPSPLRPDDPAHLGAYALLGRLGQGGFGTVYLGRTADGRRQVAVKVLHEQWAHDPDVRRRFAAEVEAAQRVPPHCTVELLDADVTAARPYMVSEYVPGPSLGRAVREGGPFHDEGLTRLAVATATALEAIHATGLVHRDFKPENVLLGPDGPRVIDFGIARALEGASATASAMIGTPAYMAPEQFDQQRVSAAVDIFAWGAVMVYAATGRPAFSGSAPVAMRQILEGRAELHGYPGPLRPLIEAALATDPRRRPTARQLLDRLRRLSAPPQPAPPPQPPPQGAATGPPPGAGEGTAHLTAPPYAPPRIPPPRRPPVGLVAGAIGLAFALLAGGIGVIVALREGAGSDTVLAGDDQRNEEEAFVFATADIPESADPVRALHPDHLRVFGQAFETLITHEPGGTQIVGGLAEEWEVSDDGTEWTFHLREGIRFHDGDRFDAAAVCANFDRWSSLPDQDPDLVDVLPYYWETFGDSNYDSCAATDGRTAVVTFQRHTSAFPGALTLPGLGMLSPTSVEELLRRGEDTPFSALAGTGPYRLAERDPDTPRVTLERNDDYWDDEAEIATLVFEEIADENARQQALEAGEVHGAELTSPAAVAALTEAGMRTPEREPFTVLFLGYQQESAEALAEVDVRRAVAHAIDREAIIEAGLLPAGSTQATQFVPEAVDGWSSDVPDHDHDPELARELLEGSDQGDLELELCFSEDPRFYLPEPAGIAEAITADLEEAGLSVTLEPAVGADHLSRVFGGECDLYLLGMGGDYNDAGNFLSWFLSYDEAWGFRDDTVFDAVARAGEEPDSDTRVDLYEAANEAIMDHLPGLPLAEVARPVVFVPDVEPPEPSPLGQERFADASFD